MPDQDAHTGPSAEATNAQHCDGDSDVLSDPLLRAAARATDPAAGLPEGPPGLSAAEIRARADDRRAQRRHRRRVALAAVTVAAVVASGAGAGVAAFAEGTRNAATASASGASVTASPPTAAPPPKRAPASAIGGGSPRAQALAMADRLQRAPADTSRGAFSYLEVRRWGHEPFPDASGQLPPSVQRTQWWRNAAGAGRAVTWDETDRCRQEGGDTRSGGGLDGPVGIQGRIATDPARLRRQLTAGALPEERSPRHLVSTIMFLPDWGYLTLPVRAAILRLLADLPGLQPLTPTKDRVGRPAVRVAVRDTDTAGTVLDVVLLLDPTRGQLLAAYHEVVGEPASDDPAYRASLTGYRLYLDQRRTSSVDQPAAGCPATPAAPAIGGR